MRLLRTAILLAAILCALSVSPAESSSLNFADVFNPSDVFLSNQGSGGQTCAGTNGVTDTTNATSSGCGTLSWSHTILPSYNPLTDTLTSGSLTLSFYDDGDSPDETYSLALDLFTDTDHTITSRSTPASPFSFSFNVLSYIVDGTLNVTLTNNQGGNHDFVFAQSTLVVAGDLASASASAPVITSAPEPASLILLGTGLTGVAALRKRLARRQN